MPTSTTKLVEISKRNTLRIWNLVANTIRKRDLAAAKKIPFTTLCSGIIPPVPRPEANLKGPEFDAWGMFAERSLGLLVIGCFVWVVAMFLYSVYAEGKKRELWESGQSIYAYGPIIYYILNIGFAVLVPFVSYKPIETCTYFSAGVLCIMLGYYFNSRPGIGPFIFPCILVSFAHLASVWTFFVYCMFILCALLGYNLAEVRSALKTSQHSSDLIWTVIENFLSVFVFWGNLDKAFKTLKSPPHPTDKEEIKKLKRSVRNVFLILFSMVLIAILACIVWRLSFYFIMILNNLIKIYFYILLGI